MEKPLKHLLQSSLDPLSLLSLLEELGSQGYIEREQRAQASPKPPAYSAVLVC